MLLQHTAFHIIIKENKWTFFDFIKRYSQTGHDTLNTNRSKGEPIINAKITNRGGHIAKINPDHRSHMGQKIMLRRTLSQQTGLNPRASCRAS